MTAQIFTGDTFSTIELCHRPRNFFVDGAFVVNKPLVLGAQHLQRTLDDLVGVLIGPGLDRLRDRLLVLLAAVRCS